MVFCVGGFAVVMTSLWVQPNLCTQPASVLDTACLVRAWRWRGVEIVLFGAFYCVMLRPNKERYGTLVFQFYDVMASIDNLFGKGDVPQSVVMLSYGLSNYCVWGLLNI